MVETVCKFHASCFSPTAIPLKVHGHKPVIVFDFEMFAQDHLFFFKNVF
jgi:hypothetical protein